MPTFARPAQDMIADLSEQFLRPEEYERVAADPVERAALRERLAAAGLRDEEVALVWTHFGLDRVEDKEDDEDRSGAEGPERSGGHQDDRSGAEVTRTRMRTGRTTGF